jgi:hypothetical protein
VRTLKAIASTVGVDHIVSYPKDAKEVARDNDALTTHAEIRERDDCGEDDGCDGVDA